MQEVIKCLWRNHFWSCCLLFYLFVCGISGHFNEGPTGCESVPQCWSSARETREGSSFKGRQGW